MSNYLGYVYSGLCTDALLPSEKKTLSPRFFFFWGEGFCTQAKVTKRLLEAIFKEDRRHIRHIVSTWIIFTHLKKNVQTYERLYKIVSRCFRGVTTLDHPNSVWVAKN